MGLAQTSRIPDSNLPLSRKKVLVIEDDADAAEGMTLLLRLNGHEVEVARDGAVGVELALRFRPEVVLCDLGLPGSIDGYGVARALRASTSNAVLIAFTGHGECEDRARAHREGFQLHLVKPVDPAVLLDLIDRARPGPPRGLLDA